MDLPPPPFPEDLIEAYEGEVEGRFYRWLASDAGPDDWHRFALGANWDFHDPEVFEWIVKQPDCDKATALTLFWLAQPAFALEFPNDEHTQRGLVELIRQRWVTGGYNRHELAFEPELDVWLPDFDALKAKAGERVDAELPESMRRALPGRRLEPDDSIEGIPGRFWPEELR